MDFLLPPELVLLLIERMDVETIIWFGQTNRQLYSIVISSSVRNHLVTRYAFPPIIVEDWWPHFLRYYDSSYISNRSQRYLSGKQYLRLVAKSGRLDLLQNYPISNPRKLCKIAAKAGHRSIVKYLSPDNSIAPSAARGGLFDIVDAIINSREKERNKIARAAARGDHPEIINQMILCGNVDPLEIALGGARGGHQYIVEEMLQYGVDRSTLAIQAARGGHLDLIKFLATINYGPMLLAASIKGRLNVLRYLLQFPIPTSILVESAYQCAIRGHLSAWELLPPFSPGQYTRFLVSVLTVGPKYMSRNPFLAVYQHAEMCKYLYPKIDPHDIELIVELAAEKGQLIGDNYAAGMRGAAKGGHIAIIDRMMEHGATNFEATMLIGAKHGHLHVVHRMLEYGATNYHAAAIEAILGGHLSILEVMLDLGANSIAEYLIVAIEFHHPSIVKYLIQQGATNCHAGLIVAAREGDLDLVELMLEHGATEYQPAIDAALDPVVATTAHREIITRLRSLQ